VEDKRTPTHKRIVRAETGREEWKVKAVKRREEIQKLNQEIKDIKERNNHLAEQLNEAQKEINFLKKNS
jgi:predicted  nucleic acid-binding Zn-ribbon protein